MALDHLRLAAITEADLQGLINAGVPEGPSIEFKRQTYGNADADVKEFLKDASSFANGGGGHLLIGIDETGGVASALSPFVGDVDKEIGRLENLIRDGIEPRIQASLHAAPVAGGHVIVIRVSPSWFPPHRVSARRTNRIYVRGSSGAYEASMDEMRNLFTAAASMRANALAFRDDRLVSIQAGVTPVVLAAEPSRIVVHISPFSAFGTSPSQIGLAEVMERDSAFRPMDASSYTPTINFDGFLTSRGGDECFGYTQLYRDGRIEAVKVRAVSDSSGRRLIPNVPLERATLGSIPHYVRGLRALDISTPLLVAISLQNVAGASLAVSDHMWDDPPPIRIAELRLPTVVLEAESEVKDIQRALRPAFDALWNSAGFVAAQSFDEQGFWKGQK